MDDEAKVCTEQARDRERDKDEDEEIEEEREDGEGGCSGGRRRGCAREQVCVVHERLANRPPLPLTAYSSSIFILISLLSSTLLQGDITP